LQKSLRKLLNLNLRRRPNKRTRAGQSFPPRKKEKDDLSKKLMYIIP